MSDVPAQPKDFSFDSVKQSLAQACGAVFGWMRREPLQAVLLALFAATLVYFYGLHAVFMNGTESAARWTLNAWNEENDLEHGWMILPIALGVVWWHREDLAKAQKQPSGLGLAIVICAVLTFVFAVWTLQARLAIVSVPMLAYGVVRYLWGAATARVIIFPCIFLLFMVPAGFLVSKTVALQNLSAIVAEKLSGALGFGVVARGANLIALDGSFQFEVSGGCSGIRSLTAMMMLAALYVHFTQRQLWKKVLIFASSLLCALVGNFFRIFSVVVFAKLIDKDIAAGIYHDWSGFLFFPIAVGGMVLFGRLLNFDWKKLRQRVLQPETVKTPAAKSSGPISYDY